MVLEVTLYLNSFRSVVKMHFCGVYTFCLGVRRLARTRCLEWNEWSDLRTRSKKLDFGFLRQGMLIIKTFQLYLPTHGQILSKICKPLFSSVEQELNLL